MMIFARISVAATLALLALTPSHATDWIPDREIASYCQQFLVRSESPAGTVCVSYIQGFLDGLRTTEAPAQDELEFHQHENVAHDEEAHFSAARMDALVAEYGPAARAGVCLPREFRVEQIIRVVARELRHGRAYTAGALDDYAQAALRKRYPCNIDAPAAAATPASDAAQAETAAEDDESDQSEGSVQ